MGPGPPVCDELMTIDGFLSLRALEPGDLWQECVN